jgi:hypothetical protein
MLPRISENSLPYFCLFSAQRLAQLGPVLYTEIFAVRGECKVGMAIKGRDSNWRLVIFTDTRGSIIQGRRPFHFFDVIIKSLKRNGQTTNYIMHFKALSWTTSKYRKWVLLYQLVPTGPLPLLRFREVSTRGDSIADVIDMEWFDFLEITGYWPQ